MQIGGRMSVRAWVAVVMLIALRTAAVAQARPDLSGVWVPSAVTSNATAGTGGSAALPPADLTIEHTAAALSVSRTFFESVSRQIYRLDGTESSTRSGAMTRVTRSRWDGARLIIEGRMSQVTSAGYAAWTLRETYSLNRRGQLILDSEYVASDGKVTASSKEFTRKASK